MADSAGGIVPIVPDPAPGPWAAAGLAVGERARKLAGSLLVSSNLDVYETRCAEALAAAANDALENAARVAEDMAFDAIAARIRALKGDDR